METGTTYSHMGKPSLDDTTDIKMHLNSLLAVNPFKEKLLQTILISS